MLFPAWHSCHCCVHGHIWWRGVERSGMGRYMCAQKCTQMNTRPCAHTHTEVSPKALASFSTFLNLLTCLSDPTESFRLFSLPFHRYTMRWGKVCRLNRWHHEHFWVCRIYSEVITVTVTTTTTASSPRRAKAST